MMKIIGYLLMCPLVVVIIGALYENVVDFIFRVQPYMIYNFVLNLTIAALILLSFVAGVEIVTKKREENDEMGGSDDVH